MEKAKTPTAAAQLQMDNEVMAGITVAPMFACAAICGARKQAGLIDPSVVIALVESYASGAGNMDAPPHAIVAMRARLLEFGEMVRSMSTMPYCAGRA